MFFSFCHTDHIKKWIINVDNKTVEIKAEYKKRKLNVWVDGKLHGIEPTSSITDPSSEMLLNIGNSKIIIFVDFSEIKTLPKLLVLSEKENIQGIEIARAKNLFNSLKYVYVFLFMCLIFLLFNGKAETRLYLNFTIVFIVSVLLYSARLICVDYTFSKEGFLIKGFLLKKSYLWKDLEGYEYLKSAKDIPQSLSLKFRNFSGEFILEKKYLLQDSKTYYFIKDLVEDFNSDQAVQQTNIAHEKRKVNNSKKLRLGTVLFVVIFGSIMFFKAYSGVKEYENFIEGLSVTSFTTTENEDRSVTLNYVYNEQPYTKELQPSQCGLKDESFFVIKETPSVGYLA